MQGHDYLGNDGELDARCAGDLRPQGICLARGLTVPAKNTYCRTSAITRWVTVLYCVRGLRASHPLHQADTILAAQPHTTLSRSCIVVLSGHRR